jgi:hypothetical protein
VDHLVTQEFQGSVVSAQRVRELQDTLEFPVSAATAVFLESAVTLEFLASVRIPESVACPDIQGPADIRLRLASVAIQAHQVFPVSADFQEVVFLGSVESAATRAYQACPAIQESLG